MRELGMGEGKHWPPKEAQTTHLFLCASDLRFRKFPVLTLLESMSYMLLYTLSPLPNVVSKTLMWCSSSFWRIRFFRLNTRCRVQCVPLFCLYIFFKKIHRLHHFKFMSEIYCCEPVCFFFWGGDFPERKSLRSIRTCQRQNSST